MRSQHHTERECRLCERWQSNKINKYEGGSPAARFFETRTAYFPPPSSHFKKERIFGNLTFRVGGRVGGFELRGGMVGSFGTGAIGPVGTETGTGTGIGGTVGSAPDGVGTGARMGAFGIGTGASTGAGTGAFGTGADGAGDFGTGADGAGDFGTGADGAGAFGTGADGAETGALTGDGSVADGVDTGGCTGGTRGADGATFGRMYIPAIIALSTLVVN
jgi:hypothetical protein